MTGIIVLSVHTRKISRHVKKKKKTPLWEQFSETCLFWCPKTSFTSGRKGKTEKKIPVYKPCDDRGLCLIKTRISLFNVFSFNLFCWCFCLFFTDQVSVSWSITRQGKYNLFNLCVFSVYWKWWLDLKRNTYHWKKKIMFVDEVSLLQDTLFRIQSKLWI